MTPPKTLSDRARDLALRGYGPVPIKTGAKAPPAPRFTGALYPMPSWADWLGFVEQHEGYENLAARLPASVVALDGDLYKPAAQADGYRLTDWPQTTRVSARGFGQPGGHYLYRLDGRMDQARLPSKLPGFGEILRHGHRYSMAPGSWNPDAGAQYEWLDERTGAVGLVPADDLPLMPGWLWSAISEAKPRAGHGQAATEIPDLGVECCTAVSQALAEIDWSMGRHDTMTARVWQLVRLHHEGHRGAPAAMQVLRGWFVEAMEADPRGGEGPDREFARALSDALAKSEQEAEPDSCGCLLQALDLVADDPDWFWSMRPWLTSVYRQAGQFLQQPWFLFGAVLANLSAEIPPWVVLPDIAGSRVGLNLYTALVGPPSAGKSSAMAIAREAGAGLLKGRHSWSSASGGLASGEGLAKLFGSMRLVEDDDGVKREQMAWKTRRVLARTDEIETLEAVAGRTGSTLQGIVNSAWTGSEISISYAALDKRIAMPAHEYRLSILVGAQPGKVGWLLDSADSGAPQRYLWMPANYRIEDRPDPEGFVPSIRLPLVLVGGDGLVFETRQITEIEFPDHLREQIRSRRIEQANGAPIRQHSDLQRMKVAGVLAMADGRMAVDDEDWLLADYVVRKSEATLSGLEQAQAERHTRALVATGQQAAVVEEARAEASIESRARRVARIVARHGEDPEHGCNSKCFKVIGQPVGGMAIGETRRAARAWAVGRGWVVEIPGPAGRPVLRPGTHP